MPKWSLVDFPFASGINTKLDEKNVEWPQLVELENAIFTEVGTLKKRKGYDNLSTSTYELATDKNQVRSKSLSNATKAIAARNDELVMFSDKYLLSKLQLNNGTDTDGHWLAKDPLIGCIPSSTSYLNRQDAQYQVSYAEDEASGSAVLTWIQAAGSAAGASVFISLIDLNSNSVLVTREVATDGLRPYAQRLEETGGDTYLCVFWLDDVTAAPFDLKKIAFNVSNFNSSISTGWTSTTLFSDVGGWSYSVSENPGGPGGWLSYVQNTTADIISTELNEDGTTSGSTATAAAAFTTTLTSEVRILGTGTRSFSGSRKHYVVFTDNTSGGSIRAIVYQDGTGTVFTALSTIVSSSNLFNGGCVWYDDDKFSIYVTKVGSIGAHGEFEVQIDHLDVTSSTLSATNDGKQLSNCSLVAQPFEFNSEIFIPVISHITADLQPSCFLYNHSQYLVDSSNSQDRKMILVSRFLANRADKRTISGVFGLESPIINSGNVKIGSADITRLDAQDPNNQKASSNVYEEPNAVVVKLDFNSSDLYQWAQVGNSIYFTGGCLWKYDGDVIEEVGFLQYPEKEEHTVNTSGSESYSYRIYGEKTDANGETDQSTYAGTLTIDSANITGKIDFDGIASINHTRRIWSGKLANLATFRSETDPGPDALFYRVNSLNPAATTGDNPYVEIDPTTFSVSFTDALTDANLTDEAIDYQSFSELENIAPPSPSILGLVKNRLWIAGGEIPRSVVWFSKEKRGGRPVQFNDSLFIKVDNKGGEITAIGELNQNAVIFKERSIYVVTGDGPNNIGQGFFNKPIEVANDIGCINQKTLAEIPGGLLFQSHKGIWLLGNDLTVSYVGSPAESYNSQTFTRATVVPDENYVVFLSSTGTPVVYDYSINAWCTWTNHQGKDSLIWENAYTYLTNTDYTVYKQDNSHTDGLSTQYARKVVTPWIRAGVAQGYMRCRELMLLGNFKSDHTFKIVFYYDYNNNAVDTITFTPTLSQQTVYQIRIPLTRQKFQSVKFEITENTVAETPEESYELIKLQLKVMKKPGHFPIDGNKSGGSVAGGS